MSDSKDSKKSRKKDQGGDPDDTRKELDDILGKITENERAAREKKPEGKTEIPAPEESRVKPSRETEPEGLEGILDSITEKPEEPAVEPLTILQRITGIFTGPARVFEYLRVKPDFVIPIILAIVMTVISGYLLYDIAIDDQITQYEENINIPQERKEVILDQVEASRHGVRRIIYTFVIPPVAILAIYAIVSAIFLFIGNILLGGKTQFKKIFSAYSYSYLIVILLGTLIKIPLILSRQTTKIDLSPAIFLDSSSAGSSLHNFIGSFDIFTVWFVVVFGLGFSIIYRFSKLKGILSVTIAWLMYVVVFNVVLASLLKGLFG